MGKAVAPWRKYLYLLKTMELGMWILLVGNVQRTSLVSWLFNHSWKLNLKEALK